MPTYAYRCTECSTAFDIHQSFEDEALTECPSCSGRLRKVWGSIGVTFSGSGFYRTDSRADAAKPSGETATASSSASESSAAPATATASAPAGGASD